MRINKDKILASKQKKVDIVANTYKSLGEKPSSVECAKFLQTFKSQPWNYIAENFNMLISLPIDTTEYARDMLESYKFDISHLENCKSIIENMIDSTEEYTANLANC